MGSRTSARLTSTKSIHTQLAAYAERIVNDRQSLKILEVFTRQWRSVFTRLHDLLRKEADLAASIQLGGQPVQWVVLREEHGRLRERLDRDVHDFISFLRQVLRYAAEDKRALEKDQRLIIRLLQPDRAQAFKAIAEAGIASEEAYVHAITYLTRLMQRTEQLVKRLDRIKSILNKAVESGRIDEKDLRFIEETRLQAQKLEEEFGRVEDLLPGLREVDARSAERLARLAQQL